MYIDNNGKIRYDDILEMKIAPIYLSEDQWREWQGVVSRRKPLGIPPIPIDDSAE